MSGILPVQLSIDVFWNIVEITKNNIKTLGSYKNIFRNIIISPFPCNSSKFITDTVCGENLTGFEQIRHLADKSKQLISKLLAKKQIKKNTGHLQNNMNEINKINSTNKDNILCSLSKFTTHGICKLNEINTRLLSNKMKMGLIGTSIIPDKVDSALNSSSNILNNDLSDSQLESEIENINSDLTDITDVNDSMEEVTNDSMEEVTDEIDYNTDTEKDVGKAKGKDKGKGSDKAKDKTKDKGKGSDKAKDKTKGKGKSPVPNKKTPSRPSKSKRRGKKQRGGEFNNIVDPITNRLVPINSGLGNKILSNYANVIK
tara:strand:- start:196 stop:1140 length:945 start_codon:yes stop_codon:yes gene_type:complete